MKKKSQLKMLAFAFAFISLFGAGGLLLRTSATAAAAANGSPATALASLPASDFVIFVDTQRLVTDTLPNFLAGDPTLMGKINSCLDRFKSETNIDARSFDNLAIGLRFNGSSRHGNFNFVAIARGQFNATQMIEAGFAAARKKERITYIEEQYQGKKLYILATTREANDDSMPAKPDSERMAVAEIDSNTIAVGDLESVRAALNPEVARASQELVGLATQNSGAVAGFAGNIPAGFTASLGLHGDKTTNLAATIKQVYGSFSTTGTEAEAVVTLRTETAEQAQDLSQAISGLKLISKMGVGQVTGGNQNAEARALMSLADGLSVNARGTDVELKLNVKQADVAPLMRDF